MTYVYDPEKRLEFPNQGDSSPHSISETKIKALSLHLSHFFFLEHKTMWQIDQIMAQSTVSKNVLVSGGARGIGRAIARYFLEAGNRVYIFDIQEDELEYTVTQHLKNYHRAGRVAYSVCDLRSVDSIRSCVATAAKNFFNGRIDVLINNGSIASPYWKEGKTMEDKDTFAQWQAYMETNLTAPFATSQAAIPYMKTEQRDRDTGAQKLGDAGPCVINIGSFRALQSDPNQEGYAASKAGQLGLTHAMAVSLSCVFLFLFWGHLRFVVWRMGEDRLLMEVMTQVSLGHLGIRVNLVAPGRIKVAHESREGDEKGESWEGQVSEKDVDDHAVNRAGRPRDIADACLYLVHAAFVTGVSFLFPFTHPFILCGSWIPRLTVLQQDITVDGGASRQK